MTTAEPATYTGDAVAAKASIFNIAKQLGELNRIPIARPAGEKRLMRNVVRTLPTGIRGVFDQLRRSMEVLRSHTPLQPDEQKALELWGR
jgi:hypothetical protein